MRHVTLHSMLQSARQMSRRLTCAFSKKGVLVCLFTLIFASTFFTSCYREPELHLPDMDVDINIRRFDINIDYIWTYEVGYDWAAEWVYGWDDEDKRRFGELLYTDPTVFNVRCYYTRNIQYGPHFSSLPPVTTTDTIVPCKFQFGFWDILVWSEGEPLNNEPQSLNINETMERVIAFTNPAQRAARHQAPPNNRARYAPEQLFAAYDRGEEINRSLEGFDYDSARNVYVKRLSVEMHPITYIYLTQVILHNNKNRIVHIDGPTDISGFADSTNVNTGVAGNNPITVTYLSRFKPSVTIPATGEEVAVVGGRVMTFGILNQNSYSITDPSDVKDSQEHYMDISMQFNNGVDSTFSFNVTDQVRKRWKGGVITIELDMDTVPTPRPPGPGGSAFNAIVKDYEEVELPIFDM